MSEIPDFDCPRGGNHWRGRGKRAVCSKCGQTMMEDVRAIVARAKAENWPTGEVLTATRRVFRRYSENSAP